VEACGHDARQVTKAEGTRQRKKPFFPCPLYKTRKTVKKEALRWSDKKRPETGKATISHMSETKERTPHNRKFTMKHKKVRKFAEGI